MESTKIEKTEKTETLETKEIEKNEIQENEDKKEEGESKESKLSVEVVENKKKNKKNKDSWKKAKQNTWIYITNLPKDIDADLLYQVFSKYGIIQMDEFNKPRIKLYRDEKGELKGDASICYLKEESVHEAIYLMNDSLLRYTDKEPIKVSEAVFEKKENSGKRNIVSSKALKIRKIRRDQQLAWNEDEETNDYGLKIIVLENVFDINRVKEPGFLEELRNDMMLGCEPFGEVSKITIFDTNPNGIVVVKFTTSAAAENCIKKMNGRMYDGRKLISYYWDGVTNYKTRLTEEEEEKRLDALVQDQKE